MKNIKKNKGVLFRISGLPGSGKTRVAKKLLSEIRKSYGPTIMWSGDDIRRIFKNRDYHPDKRYKFGVQNVKLIKYFTNQKINVIFATVGLDKKIRSFTKKNISNYLEIFIRTDFKKLKKMGLRKFYKSKSVYVWGKDIKPEFPTNPDIEIKNDFKISINQISLKIIDQINKQL